MDDQNQPPKPPGYPEPPNQGPRLRPNERDVRDLKVAQNLVMVASIAGPVSLFEACSSQLPDWCAPSSRSRS